jgi:hypothetical protein
MDGFFGDDAQVTVIVIPRHSRAGGNPTHDGGILSNGDGAFLRGSWVDRWSLRSPPARE